MYMYADDTAIHVVAPCPDMVSIHLNDTLNKFYKIGVTANFPPLCGIEHNDSLTLLGVTITRRL